MTVYLSLLSFLLHNATRLLFIVAALLVFRALERRGRRETALNIVLGTLLLDIAVFPRYGETQGLLQPTALGHSFDLCSVLATVALLARRRRSSTVRLPLAGAAWALFLLWTMTGVVRGVMSGNSRSFAFYEAEILLHVGVLALLVAGVPVARLTSSRGLPLLSWCFAPVALIIAVSSVAKHSLPLNLPLLPGSQLGEMGGDAATIFSSLGAICLVIAMTRAAGNRSGLVPAIVLLVAPLVAGQRAAVLGLAAALLVILVGFLYQGRSRVLRVHTGEVLLASLLVCSFAALGTAVVTTTADGSGQALTAQIDKTFSSTAKQQSAQSRRNQWGKALERVGQAPLTGNGLGATYVYFELSQNALVISDVTHDIPLDVAFRTGLVGVLLLVTATFASVAEGVRTFRSRAGPQVRALALGALAVFVALVVKGSVESIFEKHRLAVLLGVAIGLLAAAFREHTGDADDILASYEDSLGALVEQPPNLMWRSNAWT